jgi:quinol monooxygenase YgiN
VALWLRLSGPAAAVDALAASLTAASVPVVQAPEDGPFGRYFAVADPDGYVVTVHGDHAPVRAATRIAADAPLITLINVFEVEPARQRELVFLLEHATAEVMRHLPGFISANLHRSVDGTRVANYAQWASREAFENMLREPRAQVHMRAAAEMAQAEPVLYEVASVHHAA